MDIGPLNDLQRMVPVRGADSGMETRSHGGRASAEAAATNLSSARKLDKVAEAMRKERGIQMEFDADINRVIVHVTDKKTGQPVSQIPTEELVEFMKQFGESLRVPSEGEM